MTHSYTVNHSHMIADTSLPHSWSCLIKVPPSPPPPLKKKEGNKNSETCVTHSHTVNHSHMACWFFPTSLPKLSPCRRCLIIHVSENNRHTCHQSCSPLPLHQAHDRRQVQQTGSQHLDCFAPPPPPHDQKDSWCSEPSQPTTQGYISIRAKNKRPKRQQYFLILIKFVWLQLIN